MKQRMIHAKQLDKLTSVLFSYNDIAITQEGAVVVLDKDQILELAQLICNERMDQQYYENMKTRRD